MSDGENPKPQEKRVITMDENFSRKGLVTSQSNGPAKPPVSFLSGSGTPVKIPPPSQKKDN
jgi:hypothetical protein